MFSISMLDDKIGWVWLAVMSGFGLADLLAAYTLEMEIAISYGEAADTDDMGA